MGGNETWEKIYGGGILIRDNLTGHYRIVQRNNQENYTYNPLEETNNKYYDTVKGQIPTALSLFGNGLDTKYGPDNGATKFYGRIAIGAVQTLNVSQRLSGTLLGGKVALRLVQAVRHWTKTRNCEHLLVHVTNGVDVQEADKYFRRCGMKTVGGNYGEAV